MADPLISVIIPVFNTPERHLDKCISSVVNQTWAHTEILLVDDGSDQFTQTYCTEISQTDSRIRLLRQDNKGVSSARNLGLTKANGDYVTFVDSDDELLPGALERLLRVADTEKADVVCAQYSTSKAKMRSLQEGLTRAIPGEDAAIRLLYGQKIATGPVAKLFTREALHRQLFDTSLTFAEDLHFNFHVLCNSEKVLIDNSVLYWYDTSTANSATRGGFNPSRMDGLKSLKSVLSSSYARQNDDIYRAAQYRLFMEALFTLISIKNRKIYPSYWQECLRVMRKTRFTCLSNPNVKISDKFFIITSFLNSGMTVRLYVLKRRLKGNAVRLKIRT